MFPKNCPWCEQQITLHQLGSRPSKRPPKWYQFSRNAQVCPYCSGSVKLGGKAFRFLGLVAPLFILTLLQLFIDSDLLSIKYLTESFSVLAAIGFLGVYYFSRFEKNETV